jgi:ATP-dependent Clp protease adaptor protein ClpS
MNGLLEKVEQDADFKQASINRRPGMYEVFLYNDDFTPMAFVVEVLQSFFHMDALRAKQVMMKAHTKGKAVCGVYVREIAETKIDQAFNFAREHDHPLKWTMEEES